MISSGMVPAGPILKLLRERSVCAPQYLSAGTFTSPMVSCSILYSMLFACVIIGFYFYYKFKAQISDRTICVAIFTPT